jgi:hypothetical protein
VPNQLLQQTAAAIMVPESSLSVGAAVAAELSFGGKSETASCEIGMTTLSEPGVEEAISQSRASFDGGHDLWWLPFLGALMHIDKSHGGVWVERLVHRLLDLPELQNEPQYKADLVELSRLRSDKAPEESFYERAEQIWYRGSGPELANKAISKLFALVAREMYPHDLHPLYLYSGVVCNLVELLGYQPAVFTRAVEEFRSLSQGSNHGLSRPRDRPR